MSKKQSENKDSFTAECSRKTKETDVRVKLNIQGQGNTCIDTAMGYVDHMLTLMAFWAGFDLDMQVKGDLEVDAHHSLEDAGLCLGDALAGIVSARKDISRVGWAKVPMDEALSEVTLDISGRPYLVYSDQILPAMIFNQEKDIWREFFKSFSNRAGINLHINFLYGLNGHHLLESAFKATGLALKQALSSTEREVFSTKGHLDY
ncbi:MAG: imidazoleglycerol-phosphate dehydratase HisB [Thermodesulfobacteriota bacterium]